MRETIKGNIGDDPSTPDVNEAWVDDEPKASPKQKQSKKAPKPGAQSAFSVFISSDEEASVYDLGIGDSRVRGSWDGSYTCMVESPKSSREHDEAPRLVGSDYQGRG